MLTLNSASTYLTRGRLCCNGAAYHRRISVNGAFVIHALGIPVGMVWRSQYEECRPAIEILVGDSLCRGQQHSFGKRQRRRYEP